MEQIQERRNFPRFKVNDVSIAINKKVLGYVIDISLGGLAFEYYSDDFKSSNHSEIGIYHLEKGFLVTGLQCKMIRDIIVEPKTIVNSAIMKLCAVQFLEVSTEQQNSLNYYIDKHTNNKE